VVRKSKSGIIGDSSPCYDCYMRMCDLGVKTLVYSTEDGGFTKQKFRDYTPKQKSLGRYFIELGYKQIHRNHITKTIQDRNGRSVISNYILKDTTSDSSSVTTWSSTDNSDTESLNSFY